MKKLFLIFLLISSCGILSFSAPTIGGPTIGPSSGGSSSSGGTTTNQVIQIMATNYAAGYGIMVNVKSPPYNATGDGTTDDTVAFARAMTNRNTIIYVPGGTNIYIVGTNGTAITNNFRMVGDGDSSIIKLKTGQAVNTDSYNSCFIFRNRGFISEYIDLRFDGSAAANQAAAQGGTTNQPPYYTGADRSGIFLSSNTNGISRAVRCTFANFKGTGVYIRGSENGQNDLTGKIIVEDCVFTNCYRGIWTDGGGTADYTRIENNVFFTNYIGCQIDGGNVTVVGNQFVKNYEAFFGNPSDSRWHNIIVGNTINHSGLACFFLTACGTGAIIEGNAIAGSGDIYLNSGTSNQIFSVNRFNSFNIYSAPGNLNNKFENNVYGSGAPTTTGTGITLQNNNFMPDGTVYPVDVSSNGISSAKAKDFNGLTVTNVSSLSLAAGTWDISGNLTWVLSDVTTALLKYQGTIGTTTATISTDGSEVVTFHTSEMDNAPVGISIPSRRFNLTDTTTIYLVAGSDAAAGTTVKVYGTIVATRARQQNN